jgi:peptidoglycan hydrolase-like protein with peptidoglycan-binding domain
MPIRILRLGSEGPDVRRWQNFLVGLGHLTGAVDGLFGPMTEKASKAYQRPRDISADGIVGPFTFGRALTDGFDIGFQDAPEPTGDTILAGDTDLKALSESSRKRLFGEFLFRPAPTPQSPEAIEILDGWEAQNIQLVTITELKGVPTFGQPNSGRTRFHNKAADQLQALWAAWAKAGLARRILTYDGSFAARFVRGSRETLSNHAFGSAFDVNAQWNGLGRIPALEGSNGSVRELVEIANNHGFFWGGHFKGRPDGMHFEVARLL